MQLLPVALQSGSMLGNVAAGIGAVTSVMSGMYKANVAKANAQISQDNAVRVQKEAALAAQMQDLDAQQEIGAMLAQTSASGFNVGVGSGALQRSSAQELAGRDRGFTIYEGQRQAAAHLQDAEIYKSEASASLIGGALGAVSSILDAPSLISDATKTKKKGVI